MHSSRMPTRGTTHSSSTHSIPDINASLAANTDKNGNSKSIKIHETKETPNTRLHSSPKEDHQRLCSVVGTMSQELKDQGFPLNPVAYFGATISSLEHLSQDLACGTDPVAAARVVFLSEVLPRVSPAALRSRMGSVLETVRRVLMSCAASVRALGEALPCVLHVVVVGGMRFGRTME